MSGQKSAEIVDVVSRAFNHAFDMDDSVGLIKDLLIAIDAIARADVEDPYSSAITRMVTIGEKAINEVGGHRDAISGLLHRYADPSSVLPTAHGRHGGAAA